MKSARQRRRSAIIAVISALVVVLCLLALVIAIVPDGSSQPGPGYSPPAIEPVVLMELSPQDAIAANDAQPFVTGPIIAAAPFRFTGDSANSARAADCLAAAVLYEAGDDAVGQRAVAQVVLNRLRHPAFPKSICGVVFQGSERSTGCQFTFTCDGALARRYGDAAWQRARGIAIDAMSGAVYAPVGLATHYHTNWVRPYWSPSLDKVAQVGTHLFFRWPGYWGSPRAFSGNGNGQEPAISRLAALSASHASATGLMTGEVAAAAVSDAAVAAAITAVVPRQNRMLGDTIILTLERGQPPESFPALAQAACAGRSYCKVMGWTNPQLTPASEAMSDMARAAMSFSYLRDDQRDLERVLWNCDEFRREQQVQCMRR